MIPRLIDGDIRVDPRRLSTALRGLSAAATSSVCCAADAHGLLAAALTAH